MVTLPESGVLRPAGGKNMAEVRDQAIGNIDRRGRDAAQGDAGNDPGFRIIQAIMGAGRNFAAVMLQKIQARLTREIRLRRYSRRVLRRRG